MIRNAASKVMWVGRATVFLVGLAVVLRLATAALAGTGVGATFNLGKQNTVNRLSQLVGSIDNAMLRVDNNNAGTNATALNLQVEPGRTPMKVNPNTKVDSLNADLLDGQDASAFAQANTNAFVRSSTYRAEDPPSAGTLLGDGSRVNSKSCLPGDRLLSGDRPT